MVEMRTLAPTIFDALKAVEQGCRKVLDDPHFKPEMFFWMRIIDNACYGCLATSTLLQLTNKTAKEVVTKFPHTEIIPAEKTAKERASAFGISGEDGTTLHSDFSLFEQAIDSLRRSELMPLLQFYNLAEHENANEADVWLFENNIESMGYGTTKEDLIDYADFIHDSLLPLMNIWFAPGN